MNINQATVRYGGITALSNLTFQVRQNEICALIGPNGAGKTTAFNAISRLIPLTSGSISMGGIDLTRMRADQISQLNITRTFQNLALWPSMTVLENVMVGAHHLGRQGFLSSSLRIGTKKEEAMLEAQAIRVLEQLDIADLAQQKCAGLPYGSLKRIELARALAGNPKLLMLDEPASGLTQGEVNELGAVIRRLKEDNKISILLVEHHMQLVMAIADWIVALDFGRKLVEGTAVTVQGNQQLVEAYLGRRSRRSDG